MARVGDAVRHPVWGEGTIRSILDGGRRWRISFAHSPDLPRVVPAELLEVERRELPVLDLDAPAADLRQALEALRLGVVPAAGLEALTVAREAELAAIRDLVASARGLLLLSGGYGTGKTHLIEVAENRALSSGMLVARATFDPVEVPPSHPLRLYRALARGIRYPGGTATGLQPLLEKLAGSRAHRTHDGERFHRYLTPAAWSLEFGDDVLVEDLVAWVEGQLPQVNRELTGDLRRFGWPGPSLLALPDYRTFGQIMAYLLGGIATWARDAGYRGLLVLVDEAEYLDQLESVSRDMATNVLRYLAAASLDREELAFDPAAVYRGGQSVHRAIPESFVPDQPLAVMCAFTPHPTVNQVLRGIVGRRERILDLDPIPLAELGLLADQILALYREAWPHLDPPEADRRVVKAAITGAFRRGEMQNTRQAARLVVEFWDLYRSDAARALAALRS